MDGRLHGRAAEREHLEEAVAGAARGHGAVVVLRGEAGIGKSRLLAHLADRAAGAGFEVRAGRGDELARGRPFGPIAQALELRPGSPDPDGAAVGRLLAGDEQLDHTGLPLAGEVRFRVLDTVLSLVDRTTARSPLALVVDDLHWADEDTLRVVVALAGRAASLPLLVAATARRHPQGPELTQALWSLEDRGATVLDIGPLDPQPIEALVADLVDGAPGPELLSEVGRAEGNPFLAIELVAAHSAAGTLVRREGVVELDSSGVLPDLGGAVLGRLEHLRPATVELLQAASVLGRTFSLQVAAGLLGRRGVEVATDVDEALAAGLLEPAGDRLSFSHDLVREAIYTDLPAATRTGLHVAAARALAAADAEAFDVATQIERSAGGAGDEAAGWLLQGAQQVRVTAPGTAAAFLRRATELLEPGDPRWLTAQARLAEASIFSGALVEGEALAQRCLTREGLDPEDHRALTYLVGQALFLQGRLPEAAARFERSAEGGGRDAAAALADGAVTMLLSGDLGEASRLADRAREVATAGGDPEVEVFVLAVLSWIRALEGDLARGLELGRRAVERAEAIGGLEVHRNVPYVFYAQVLLWADRDDEALVAIERATELGERLGLVWDVPLRHLLRARANHRGGEWDEAIAEAQAGLSQSADQDGSIADVWLWALLARLHVARGERDETEQALLAAEAAVEAGGQGSDQVAWARGLLAELDGDLDVAGFYLDLLWDGLEERGLDYYVWDIAPDVVRVASRRDDRDRVDRVLRSLAAIAARAADSSAPAVEARCRGIADQDPDAFLQALALVEDRKGTSRPVELALLQQESASVLRAAGRTGEAEELRAAAEPVLAAARAQPPGVPGLDEPASGDEAPTFGWAALTARELEVVRLLAESLSNAEIAERLCCSRRTVESHLSHAYTKLGISSRVELAVEAAARLGVSP